VALSWNVADPDSPLTSTSGCDPQSVTGEGAVAFTCTAVSPGGTNSQPVTIKRDSVAPAVPSFTGITAGTFSTTSVPAQSAVGCTSSDATSGLASCVVTGYSAAPGAHTLTATATDQSGLTSTATLAYSVVRPAAASRLSASARQKLRTVLKSGFKFTLTIATDDTTVKATLKSGRTTVGTLKKTVQPGKQKFTIKLNKKGKKLLRRAKKAKLALSGAATSVDADPAKFTKKLTLKR
jgi:hypothetical protein